MAADAAWTNGKEEKLGPGQYTFLVEMTSGSAKLQIKSIGQAGSSYQDVEDSSKTASGQINLTLNGKAHIKAVLTGDAELYQISPHAE